MPTLVSPQGVANSSNGKTGNSLNLPAGLPQYGGTCPGATDICQAVCFGLQGRFVPGMNGALVTDRNWAILRDAPGLIASLPLRPAKPRLATVSNGDGTWTTTTVPGKPLPQRMFGVGDFWSVAAVDAVFDLAEANPEREFWEYSRSRKEIGQVLRRRSVPKNLTLFMSVDRDNHRAAKRFAARHGLPVAYMATPGDHIPGESEALLCPELDPRLKDRFPLTKVAEESPCVRCGWCFSQKVAKHRLIRGTVFPTHLSTQHPMWKVTRDWLKEWHESRKAKVAE